MSVQLRPLPVDRLGAWRDGAIERLTAPLLPLPDQDLDRAFAVTAERIDTRLGQDATGSGSGVYEVLLDGAVVGSVWLRTPDGALTLVDAELDDPGQAPALRRTVEDVAAQRRETLEVHVAAGDPVTETLAEGMTLSSMRMLLDFADVEPVTDGRVLLRPMTDLEYTAHQAEASEEYIATRVRNGETEERARRVHREHEAETLPQGMHTPGHAFLHAAVDGVPAGMLWLYLGDARAFVYRVQVDAGRRGQGLGRALMHSAAAYAARHGRIGMALNVFGDNLVAQNLYASLGYRPSTLTYRSA